MEPILYKPDCPQNIVDTAPDYIQRLADYYRDKVVVPRKTPQDALAGMQNSYLLSLKKTTLEDLDAVTASIIKELFSGAETEFLWKLERNSHSAVFYAYFDQRYTGYPSAICVSYQKKRDYLLSNCALLEQFMLYVRGIEKADVQNQTPAYKVYLDSFYSFNMELETLQYLQACL